MKLLVGAPTAFQYFLTRLAMLLQRFILCLCIIVVSFCLALELSHGSSNDQAEPKFQFDEVSVKYIEKGHRKLLGMASSKAFLLKSLQSSWVNKRHFQEGESTVVSWNLRKAPSGPDPLHHNGKKPAKPRTP